MAKISLSPDPAATVRLFSRADCFRGGDLANDASLSGGGKLSLPCRAVRFRCVFANIDDCLDAFSDDDGMNMVVLAYDAVDCPSLLLLLIV